ncbi:FUSC family protein [Angustibacter sp. Root456]|uniref:FUSC family protein n=1 Tax=Angustibacter sp. Root456 TaxID=1736539 RepID=UPI0007016E8E|nr:FUSC family protein [Angustibacter sp. Root456]KQX61686.1 hypothetical protein ASD06_13910 [Angustibacter sp. Root456]
MDWRGIRGTLAEGLDRARASDPGLGRLRQATAVAVSVGTALVVEYGVARLGGADSKGTLVAMILGAVVAMMGSNALIGPEVWGKVKVAALFPVAIGLGLALGTLVGAHTDLMLAVFVAVIFVAVFVRRFGTPFFFYGFMLWMGYFFASFLKTRPAMIPHLMVAVVVGSAWVLLLSITVLRTNPRSVMRSTLRAFDSRARWVVGECADLLEVSAGRGNRRDRAVRQISARHAGLAETALMAESWSDDAGALPDGWSPPALRRRLLETQQAVERIAQASVDLVDVRSPLRDAAHTVLDLVARRQDAAAREAAVHLSDLGDARRGQTRAAAAARQLSVGTLELLDLTAHASEPPEVAPGEDEFTPTTALFLGNLPGSPAVARDVPARGTRWNPLARLDLTSRQAVQVALAGALAIVLGRFLDPTRYYWAVIAAFVTFTGTGTRVDSLTKGVNRVVGTLVGLVAAVLVAHLTDGHPAAIVLTILLCVFFGFYLVRVSYAAMIFFITIMVGQMYTVLHTFSDALLVLRLEETAVGAAAGIVVAVVVTPLSTRDTVRSAASALLHSLADLLSAVAGGAPGSDLDARSRTLDDQVRRLRLVTRPLIRSSPWRHESQQTRHRLALLVSTAVQARALTVASYRCPTRHPVVAQVCRELAESSSTLAGARRDVPVTAAAPALQRADQALFAERLPDDLDPLVRPLAHLHATLRELAQVPLLRRQ